MTRQTPEKSATGEVTNFYQKINVAVVKLNAPLQKGDRISIEGTTTSFQQTVSSMQIEHQPVDKAEAGQHIGLKVKDRVRPGDIIYRLE